MGGTNHEEKNLGVGVAALLAALLALSGVAQSAMWVGAELGGNFNAYPNIQVNGGGISNSSQTEIRPSIIGGVTIGYDFVNSGFGGYNYPSWMQYFSFAMDLTYNRLAIQDAGPGIGKFFSANSRLNGYEVAWTFLFMAHYGFMRDDVAPTGRINPYLGVGPAIVWTGVDYTLPFYSKSFTSHFGTSAMNVALVIEPGVRWVCFKNVSVDTALRYRLSAPSWDVNGISIKANPLSQFACLVRANYHF
jgi:opacity protein-like surface antigen